MKTRHTSRESAKRKITAYLVGLVTLASAAIFTATLVSAAVYDPGATGMPAGIPIYSATASAVGHVQSTGTSASTTSPTNTAPTTGAAAIVTPVVHPLNYPARLLIPSLNINAAVQDVGVNTKGNIGTPNNFTDVGWYSYGTLPGQPGVAVIDGHVDNGLGLDGVFKHLSSLEDGDEVDVVTYGGKESRFIVTDVQAYDYQNVPPSAVFGDGDGSAAQSSLLKLITCDGTWVSGGDTYNERLIVTAELVPGNTQ